MTKPKSNTIQYLYIWKKLNNSILPEEKALLNAWLDESPENMQFYLNAKHFNGKESVDKTTSEWIRLKNNLARRKRKRIYTYSIAATLALLVGLTFILNLKTENRTAELPQVLAPGVEKATLILSDGTSHQLENKTAIQLEEDGVYISGKNGTLTYSSKKKRKAATEYNTIHVPRGGEFFLVLSDSTKVWINSETMLRYPTVFDKNERKVEVIGEAYFEVSKDKNKPFFVKTDNQLIRVTGTAFNVSTYCVNGAIVTTLVEGSVEINSMENNDIKTILKPGDQSIFDIQTNSMTISEVNVNLFTSWKDGEYFFQNESLENMLTTLSRWYNFSYEFKTDKVKSIRFSGKLKRSDSFERILSIIEKTNEIQFAIDKNIVIVNQKRQILR